MLTSGILRICEMINLMNVCSSRFSVCPCPHLPPLSRNDVCDSPLCYHAGMKIKDSLYLIDIIRLWGMTALKLDLRITEFIEIKICFRLKKKYFFFQRHWGDGLHIFGDSLCLFNISSTFVFWPTDKMKYYP